MAVNGKKISELTEWTDPLDATFDLVLRKGALNYRASIDKLPFLSSVSNSVSRVYLNPAVADIDETPDIKNTWAKAYTAARAFADAGALVILDITQAVESSPAGIDLDSGVFDMAGIEVFCAVAKAAKLIATGGAATLQAGIYTGLSQDRVGDAANVGITVEGTAGDPGLPNRVVFKDCKLTGAVGDVLVTGTSSDNLHVHVLGESSINGVIISKGTAVQVLANIDPSVRLSAAGQTAFWYDEGAQTVIGAATTFMPENVDKVTPYRQAATATSSEIKDKNVTVEVTNAAATVGLIDNSTVRTAKTAGTNKVNLSNARIDGSVLLEGLDFAHADNTSIILGALNIVPGTKIDLSVGAATWLVTGNLVLPDDVLTGAEDLNIILCCQGSSVSATHAGYTGTLNVSGPPQASNIVESPTPPANTSQRWYSTVLKEMFFYDGTDWVSDNIYHLSYNTPGDLVNNQYMLYGSTEGDALHGPAFPFESKLVTAQYSRLNSVTCNLRVFTNGAEAAFFTIPASESGGIGPSTPAKIPSGQNISIRRTGTGVSSFTTFDVYLRRVGT